MVTARQDFLGHLPNLRHVREDLKLSRERMARLLGVSSKTVQRWEERNLSPGTPVLASRLAKIQEIARLGQAVYTSEGFRRLLRTPLAQLEGRTPLQLIEIGESDRVLSVLAADYEGLGY